jgi:8-hydroxy-5-deazaflavin:NADPH oxidoreductase
MKKIGIIGSGQVGRTLAKGFLNYNYPVMIASRDAAKQEDMKRDIGGAIRTGNFSETAAFAEIIVLAVQGLAAKDALISIEASSLSGKIIIDTTNPIAAAPPEEGVLKFFTNLDRSLMESLQEEFPSSKFVKAFSCIGNALMVNPVFPNGAKSSMFICGNDETAKLEVKKIIELFGHEVEDMGSAASARAIEPLCMLWCIPGFRSNSWSHAFKLLK